MNDEAVLDLNQFTCLDTKELARRTGYGERTIRNTLVDVVLISRVHYIRPFGRRKLLFLWENILRDMVRWQDRRVSIPMANGGVARV